jgi:hypothetical protein
MFLFSILAFITDAYKPLNYKDIHNRFQDLAERCSFIHVTTAQAEYGIGYPEYCDGCSHMIVTIGNPELKSNPQIYFSGCLHGDERVGPVVVTELATYLCNEYSKNSWIKNIVDNHLIIITPTTNAQGYNNYKREEKNSHSSIDPNRDFPFDNKNKCGESLTSQVIIKLFQNYLFRAGITFHGGESSLSYPWGAFLHYKNSKSTEAPDLEAFKIVSNTISNFSKSSVKVGSMNDIVYPVHGGLEDWAYGGGWDIEGQSACGVKNFTNIEGLKQLFFLLETHENKSPAPYLYGDESEISSESGGLIPQYIRMSLALIDLTEPYIQYSIHHSRSGLEISWEVWGAIQVHKTQIYYSSKNSTDWTSWRKTELKSGGGRWGDRTMFTENFIELNLFFKITAEVDNWVKQHHPEPDVKPQTHFVRTRTEYYRVVHNGFEIIGNPLVQTQIIGTSSMPNYVIKAEFLNKKLEILDFGEYFEVKSELDQETLFVYNFGDYILENPKQSLGEVLCGNNKEIKSGVYKDCNSPTVLAGKIVEGVKAGMSIFESNPPVSIKDFAVCYSKTANLTFEKLSENIVLVTASGEFEKIQLDASGFSINLVNSEKQSGKMLSVKNLKMIGEKIEVLIDGKISEFCQIAVSRVVKKQFLYTRIKLPMLAIILIVCLKVLIVVWVLYKKCLKKKQTLLVPKYQEIELVFTNK